MNECPELERLQALLSGALTASEEEALEEHLAGCVRCQERLRQLTSDSAAERWCRLRAWLPAGQDLPERLPGLAKYHLAGQTNPIPGEAERTGWWTLGSDGAGEDVPDVPERIARFAVTRLLGEGAFGRVYLAYDGQLEREVAVKLAKAETVCTPLQIERFLREARAAARLRHPHIVPLFEAGRDDTGYYIASAFIAGQTLAAALQAGRFDFVRTAQVVRALAEALAYAHEQGVVHRDVKPANIMLDDKGQPLLMDFGLATLRDDVEKLTHEGVIVGTPLYMAPEQAAGRRDEVGPASDQYSLGVVLYQMLCGQTPFAGPREVVLFNHFGVEPRPPRQVDRRVPRDLETICLKALAKKPAERYAGCQQLADDLRRWLDAEPIQARRASVMERTIKLARRKPTAAGLVAVCLLLAVVVGIVSTLYLSVKNAAIWDRLVRQEKSQKTREEVSGLLQQAEKPEKERRFAEANTVIDLAEAALRNQPDLRAPDLEQKIERHRAMIKPGLQARSRLEQFTPLRDEALFHETHFTGLDLAQNQARLRDALGKALDLYGLAGGSNPAGGVTDLVKQDRAYLTEAEHAELTAACYELLLVWAEAEAAGTLGAKEPREQRKQQARLALALLERADLLGRAYGLETRVYHLLKARCEAWSKGEEFTPAQARQLLAGRPQGVLDSFLAGLESYKAGQYKEAAVDCEEALRLDSRHFWARYTLALCQLRDGKWVDARASLTVCLQQRDFVMARVLRGFAASSQAAGKNNASLFADARADLDQALRQDCTPLVQYVGRVNRGVLFIQQRQWQEAIEDLQEAIRLQPDSYVGYVNLAQAHQGLKQWDKALAVLNQAIGKAPGVGLVYETRARVRRERQDQAAARADFEKAIALEPAGSASPRLAGMLVELGRLLERGGNPRAALERYDAALKAQPDYALAHRFRAEALLALGRRREAAVDLDRYLKLEREPSAQAYRARGLLHVREGQYPAAVVMFTLALQREPDDLATCCDRGWAYLLQDAARPALADFETVLHKQANNVEALLGRGNARVRLRQVAEAVLDAEAADKAGLLDERQLYNLTCIYALTVAQLELDSRGKRDPLTDRRIALYEEKALGCLNRTLDKVTPERRATFWRQQVEVDPALTAIRRGAAYFELAARYGRPGS